MLSNSNNEQSKIISERKSRILSKRTLILFFISSGIIIFLINRINFSETLHTIKSAKIELIILSIFIYFASNFFKTLRFKVLLANIKISTFKLFTIVSYHNFFNQILPARTGELTFIYYLYKIGKIDTTKGLHSLLLARIFDLIIVSIFFVLSLIFYYGYDFSKILFYLGICIGIISIILLFNIDKLINVFKNIFEFILIRFNLEHVNFMIKIKNKLNEIINEFNNFDTKKILPMLSITSILVWTALYCFSFTIINAFGIKIDFLKTIVGATGAVLTNVLPINSFGSFGTMEAGWVAGFVMTGMSEQNAIITGFGNHFINFLASGFIALFCYLVLKKIGEKIGKKK